MRKFLKEVAGNVDELGLERSVLFLRDKGEKITQRKVDRLWWK